MFYIPYFIISIKKTFLDIWPLSEEISPYLEKNGVFQPSFQIFYTNSCSGPYLSEASPFKCQ